MLEITPNFDGTLIREYCKKCKRIPGPQHYLYVAGVRGKIISAGLFEVQSDKVTILWYEGDESDHPLFDAVIRAGLNYASTQGIPTGYIPEAFREAQRIHFAELNYPAQAVFNIVNFFKKYKTCHP